MYINIKCYTSTRRLRFLFHRFTHARFHPPLWQHGDGSMPAILIPFGASHAPTNQPRAPTSYQAAAREAAATAVIRGQQRKARDARRRGGAAAAAATGVPPATRRPVITAAALLPAPPLCCSRRSRMRRQRDQQQQQHPSWPPRWPSQGKRSWITDAVFGSAASCPAAARASRSGSISPRPFKPQIARQEGSRAARERESERAR